MEDDFFKRLPVLLVHGESKEREHEADHAQRGHVVAEGRPAENIKGNPHGPRDRETNELPSGEVEGDFVLYTGKSLGTGTKGISASFLPMRKGRPAGGGP